MGLSLYAYICIDAMIHFSITTYFWNTFVSLLVQSAFSPSIPALTCSTVSLTLHASAHHLSDSSFFRPSGLFVFLSTNCYFLSLPLHHTKSLNVWLSVHTLLHTFLLYYLSLPGSLCNLTICQSIFILCCRAAALFSCVLLSFSFRPLLAANNQSILCWLSIHCYFVPPLWLLLFSFSVPSYFNSLSTFTNTLLYPQYRPCMCCLALHIQFVHPLVMFSVSRAVSSVLWSISACAVSSLVSTGEPPPGHIHWCPGQSKDQDAETGVVTSFKAIILTPVFLPVLSAWHWHLIQLLASLPYHWYWCSDIDDIASVFIILATVTLTMVSLPVLSSEASLWHWHCFLH